MSKKKGPSISESVSPNLIPMIDIMFLLLLFFMLGADMGQRELEEVILPKAKSIKEDKETHDQPGKDRLTVNVYHKYKTNNFQCAAHEHETVCREPTHWLIGIRGKDFTDLAQLQQYLEKDAAEFPKDPKNPAISERKVMIRADETAPYGRVQVVMSTCTKVGIYKIECGAALPSEDKQAH